MSKSVLKYRVLGMALSALLAGCDSGTPNDLHRYVDEMQARPEGNIEPLPDIEPYESFTYASANLKDPFAPWIEEKDESSPDTSPDNGIRPDSNRPKEALEAYPLDTLRMVGSLGRDEQQWSLVKVPDGTVYRVRPGNHIGQNYGKIIFISDQSIELIEITEDAQGGWIERSASLTVREEQ